jgi:sphinganine-1-phosphate aldolase
MTSAASESTLTSSLVAFLDNKSFRYTEHAVALLAVAFATRSLLGGRGLVANVTSLLLKHVPGVAGAVAKEQDAAIATIREELIKAERKLDNRFGDRVALPAEGVARDELLDVMRKWRAAEDGFRAGKHFGGIYSDDAALRQLEIDAFALFYDSNALYPTIFPSLRKMEVEVVNMTLALLHGRIGEACGTMTTGGSESIILAIKAYKERARALKGILDPEAILPVSAHAAHAKGCNYFGVKIVLAPVDADGRVSVDAVRRLITRNTILIVGSAPAFPQCVVDPIPALAALARQHDVGLHVDACLGGYILPFFVELGYLDVQFDFAVDGVTSISADIHKFGFGPKNASTILYRTRELRKYQFFAYADWSGGIYASPSITGSRAGGSIAAAWATLMALGANGYKTKAIEMHLTLQRLIAGIGAIPHLRVLGPPQACGVSFAVKSDSPVFRDAKDIYKIADAMGNEQRNWSFPRLQNPICCMIQVAANKRFNVDLFLKDLAASVAEVEAEPSRYGEGMAKLYGVAATVPEKSIITGLLEAYLDVVYL